LIDIPCDYWIASTQGSIVEAWLTKPLVGLTHKHSYWMCWCHQNVSPNWGWVVWQPAHWGHMVLSANVAGSTPLAPAELILSTDARPALSGQHYLSDLCRPLSQAFYQASAGLGGVNTPTAVKTYSRACVKRHDSSEWWVKLQKLTKLCGWRGQAWYGEKIRNVPQASKWIFCFFWKLTSLFFVKITHLVPYLHSVLVQMTDIPLCAVFLFDSIWHGVVPWQVMSYGGCIMIAMYHKLCNKMSLTAVSKKHDKRHFVLACIWPTLADLKCFWLVIIVKLDSFSCIVFAIDNIHAFLIITSYRAP